MNGHKRNDSFFCIFYSIEKSTTLCSHEKFGHKTDLSVSSILTFQPQWSHDMRQTFRFSGKESYCFEKSIGLELKLIPFKMKQAGLHSTEEAFLLPTQ